MSDERLADLHLRQLWLVLAVVVAGSFGALLYYGGEIYQEAPPIPDRIVATDGQLLFTGEQILAGQDVWRSIGGQELGSIWGHGRLVKILERPAGQKFTRFQDRRRHRRSGSRMSILTSRALRRRVRFSARLAGFCRGRWHQRRARRAERASFLGFVSNRDFRVPRLRPVGERALTGPCSVGKEATRGVQNRGQGYRGVAG